MVYKAFRRTFLENLEVPLFYSLIHLSSKDINSGQNKALTLQKLIVLSMERDFASQNNL